MSEDEEERKRAEQRRAWLGDPIEHGGGYRPAKTSWAQDIGCCLFEAAGAVGVFAALLVLPAWFLVG